MVKLAMDEKKIHEVVEMIVASFQAHYGSFFQTPNEIETIKGEFFSETDLAVAGSLPKCSVVQFHVARLMHKTYARFMIIFPEDEDRDISATIKEIVERVKVILRDYDKEWRERRS